MITNKFNIYNNPPSILEGLSMLEQKLKDFRLNDRQINRSVLTMKAAIPSLFQNAPQEASLTIAVTNIFGYVKIKASICGKAFDLADALSIENLFDKNGLSKEEIDTISEMILKDNASRINLKNHKNTNELTIIAQTNPHKSLHITLASLALAIISGMMMRLTLPAAAVTALDQNIFTPAVDMIMNALKLLIAPVVFFSIINCVSDYADLREFGKMGLRIFKLIGLSRVLALLSAVGAFILLRPGDPTISANIANADSIAETAKQADASIKSLITGIVPTNIIDAFANNNMLQIIFLAIVVGIATVLLAERAPILKQIFGALDALFQTIMSFMIRLMPVLLFCSITSLVLTTGISTILSVVCLLLTMLLGLSFMIVVYCLMLLFLGKVSPFIFLRKHAIPLLTVFSIGNASAALPIDMASAEKLGVPSKISSLVLPLGAILKKDASAVTLTITGLFMIRVFDVPLTRSVILIIIMEAVVLSFGAAAIPGSGVICTSIIIAQLGLPAAGVSLILGIDPIVQLFRCIINTFGDVALAVIIASRDKTLDTDRYKRQPAHMEA